MTKEDILCKFTDINYAYNNSCVFANLKKMLSELERTVVIDGVEYVAESPEIKHVSWDGEVWLSGFYKKGE